MNMIYRDRVLHNLDMHSRSELVAQLRHVGGQLAATRAESAALPLLDELVDIAGTLDVPVNHRRDDSHVFLSTPEKIAEATWTQCGGVLYALRQRRSADEARIAAEVAQRIARLAPAHR